jgi:hypothetical protein
MAVGNNELMMTMLRAICVIRDKSLLSCTTDSSHVSPEPDMKKKAVAGYPIKTPPQLGAVLQGFRKQRSLTQVQVARVRIVAKRRFGAGTGFIDRVVESHFQTIDGAGSGTGRPGSRCAPKRFGMVSYGTRKNNPGFVGLDSASIYCSLHPAALQIDPPPGSGDFASMIPHTENSPCGSDRRGNHALAAACSGTMFPTRLSGRMENQALASASVVSAR